MNTNFQFETQHIPTPSLRGIDRFAIEAGIPWQSDGYKRKSKPLQTATPTKKRDRNDEIFNSFCQR